jgi:hypothetical protein
MRQDALHKEDIKQLSCFLLISILQLTYLQVGTGEKTIWTFRSDIHIKEKR